MKALLQIERRNRLVVERDLDTVGAVQCLRIQRNSVLDSVCPGQLWIHVIGILGLFTMKHCELPDVWRAGSSEEPRIEPFRPYAIVFDRINAAQKTRGQQSVRISDQFLVDLHLIPGVDELITRLNGRIGKFDRLLTVQYAVG